MVLAYWDLLAHEAQGIRVNNRPISNARLVFRNSREGDCP